MSIKSISDLTHFFGIEETNLLANIANLGEDYFLIHNLDMLYQSCTKLKPIDESRLKIPLFLYLIIHGELYNAVSSYLRTHKSISYRCMRSALDGAFTSYYLLKKPEKIDIYLSKLSEDQDKEKNKEWKKIFLNIKRTIKSNIKTFPFAEGLPEIHEFCSIYSHSDALGILHRYYDDRENDMLQAKYFDYHQNTDDFHKWFGRLLVTFFNIFLIFWQEIFIHRAENKLSQIERNISEFQKRLKIYTEKYPVDTAESDSNNTA